MESLIRCVSYSRVSTLDQIRDDGVTIKRSLDEQKERAVEIAHANGWQYLGDYREEGKSAEELEGRTQLARLLQDARQKKFDVVICRHSDRLSRKQAAYLYIADELEVNHKIQIYNLNNPPQIIPPDQYSPRRDNMRVFRRGIEGMLSESESNDRAKRLEAGKIAQIRAGRFIYTKAPYGYRLEKRLLDNKVDRVPVPDPATYPVVELLPRLVLVERLSLREIMARLTEMGVPTPGGQRWRKAGVRYILANPFYAGRQAYRRQIEVRDGATGKKKLVPNPDPASVVYGEHKYERPWTWDEYEAIQRLFSERKKAPPRSLGSPSPFPPGCLRCGYCQGPMVFTKTGIIGKGTPYFICNNHQFNPAVCQFHHVPPDRFLQQVWDDLDGVSQSNLAAGYHPNMADNRLVAALAAQVSNLEKQLAEDLPAKRHRLNRDYLAGKIEIDDRNGLLAVLAGEERELGESLTRARAELEDAGARNRATARLLEASERWQELRGQVIGQPILAWPEGVSRHLQAVLAASYERICVAGQYDRTIAARGQKWRIKVEFHRKEI